MNHLASPGRRKITGSILGLAILLFSQAWLHINHTLADDKTSNLKVLYAGNPSSERMDDFERFLSKHFAKVGTTDLRKFSSSQAESYDVLIFDWTSTYPRDENGKIKTDDDLAMNSPRIPLLGDDFNRPVVMIGAIAGSVANRKPMAINWKCLCLSNAAHDIRVEHPICKGPLIVDLSYVEQKKPRDYFLYPGTKSLSETITVIPMQTKDFPEVDPGLVSTLETFVETDDAEAISGGINGKGPTSVAIGRHGNFFLWGFSAQPSEMTDTAQALFVNSICYMDQFDGKAPGQVTMAVDSRKWFLGTIYFMRAISDDYINDMVQQYENHIRDNPPPKSLLDEMGEDKAAYFRNNYAEHVEKVRSKIPPSILTECENDTEKLISFYESNYDYLMKIDETSYSVDFDVKMLNLSNRDIALIAKCIESLDDPQTGSKAIEILTRYTYHSFKTSQEWKTWWNANQQKIRYDKKMEKFSVE